MTETYSEIPQEDRRRIGGVVVSDAYDLVAEHAIGTPSDYEEAYREIAVLTRYQLEQAGKDVQPSRTPNASLPPLNPDAKRRTMLVEIEVGEDFEKRLDNQWEVEREIHADRYRWSWTDESKLAAANKKVEQYQKAIRFVVADLEGNSDSRVRGGFILIENHRIDNLLSQLAEGK